LIRQQEKLQKDQPLLGAPRGWLRCKKLFEEKNGWQTNRNWDDLAKSSYNL